MICAVQSRTIADEHPVVISGGRIPHVFDPDKPGPYNQIFDLMRAGLPRAVQVEFFPLSRAMRQMTSGQYDCFAMALKHSPNWARLGMDPKQYVFVGPIAWLRINAYVRKGETLTDTSADGLGIAADSTINNLKSAFAGGWGSRALIETESFVDALQLLADGRVDVALAYDVDVQSLADDHPLMGQVVASGVTVAEMEDGIMCKSSEEMLPIILGLQENLDNLAADGTLDQILNQQ